MVRKIINIDEEKCNGCGLCVPNCHEGALQIIDGKARLISDLMCDGLGNCLGHCPEGAITIEEREAEPYDEVRVMKENIIPAGENTIKAHLNHLKEHNETEYLNQAIDALKEAGISNPLESEQQEKPEPAFQGCPGSRSMKLNSGSAEKDSPSARQGTQLGNWPVQLHLAHPGAGYFTGADVLLAADCTAFACPNFHTDLLKGKILIIACPKLDENQEIYVQKLTTLINQAGINTITIARMEVPCCGGITALVMRALGEAENKVPVKEIVIGIGGDILSQNRV